MKKNNNNNNFLPNFFIIFSCLLYYLYSRVICDSDCSFIKYPDSELYLQLASEEIIFNFDSLFSNRLPYIMFIKFFGMIGIDIETSFFLINLFSLLMIYKIANNFIGAKILTFLSLIPITIFLIPYGHRDIFYAAIFFIFFFYKSLAAQFLSCLMMILLRPHSIIIIGIYYVVIFNKRMNYLILLGIIELYLLFRIDFFEKIPSFLEHVENSDGINSLYIAIFLFLVELLILFNFALKKIKNYFINSFFIIQLYLISSCIFLYFNIFSLRQLLFIMLLQFVFFARYVQTIWLKSKGAKNYEKFHY